MVHLLELMVKLTHSLNMYLPQGSGTYIPEKLLVHILFYLAMHLSCLLVLGVRIQN